jgi:hypothetical protein
MKRFFLSRAPRERFLLMTFLLVAVLVWLASAAGRARVRWQAGRDVAAELATQQLWLGRRAEIEQRAKTASASLDPARTLDANRLVGEVSGLAAAAGLSPALDAPHTQRTGQFAYHTVEVAFRRADLASLVKFYRAVAQRAPYLALEETSLTARPGNPAELDARFTVFSVEVTP